MTVAQAVRRYHTFALRVAKAQPEHADYVRGLAQSWTEALGRFAAMPLPKHVERHVRWMLQGMETSRGSAQLDWLDAFPDCLNDDLKRHAAVA